MDEASMSVDFFKDDGVFLPMLNDTGRNNFYKQALEQSAQGKVICDIGAGTGLLSVLAVQAGAKKVIAVEKNIERYQYLTEIVDSAGYGSVIETVHADFLSTNIDADLYVSETLNTQIFGENILDLSNHVVGRGKFIPGTIKIWIEAYQNHPVFTLDLSGSEAYEFDPRINIDPNFANEINSRFSEQYSLNDTVFKANQLNKLFTLLYQFKDIKLQRISKSDPLVVNLSNYTDQNNIRVRIPNESGELDNAMLVVKWEISHNSVALSSDNCWFGNVAKPMHKQFKTKPYVEFYYDPTITNWRLDY